MQETSAAFHALLQAPWQGSVVSFIPVFPIVSPQWIDGVMERGPHPFSKEMPGFLHEQWPLIDQRSLIDPFRLGRLLDLLIRVKDVPGDVVECGSWRGGSGILMALALERLGVEKRVHLFDSFEGLPAPDRDWDQGYEEGMFQSDYRELEAFIRSLGLEDRIALHKGWFEDTIPEFLKEDPKSVALLHIDCDLYRSTLVCLEGFYPLVSEGGAVVFDDFNDGCEGEKRAVETYFADRNTALEVGPAPQVYLMKQEGEHSGPYCYRERMLTYHLGTLLEDRDYLGWLERQLGYDYGGKIKTFLEAES